VLRRSFANPFANFSAAPLARQSGLPQSTVTYFLMTIAGIYKARQKDGSRPEPVVV
jgi:hypothetical protein